MIEDAAGSSFDTYTAPPADTTLNTQIATAVTDFSTTLGPETGEVYPAYDDFDDFHTTTPRSIYITGVDTLKIWATVFYVNPANLNADAGTRTWHKRMLVSVTGPSMLDTVKIPYIFSYWYFR